ncbi:serine/threonine-protein kinase [Catellatospora sp. KI3]|uniref:serine/threonine-protein kinase n=1 Tax=Catellatospora sp. KI3 TaxID=3041620 RepID=UPI0024826C05|nr:serine/threonine-protein kinase [Catellatospora sp. KI3]MDI1464133.1 serine/threonine-protein kinase [Catellatospora sp. KI3]
MALATDDPRPGLAPLSTRDPRTAGPYRLLGRLGQGGQGIVYLGVDGDERQVAVKMLSIDLEHDPKAKARFGKEIAAARRVAAFCTAQVLHADLDAEQPYVASEFIDGPTLHRQVRDRGPVTGNALYRLAVGTATALAAIHQAGIVHCDMKPDNVILGLDGPRVIDFGIARALGTHTLTGNVMGTVPYMAPERFQNIDVGPSCDVFGWAATMAFAASGRGPFGHDSLATVMARVLHEPPDLANLSGTLLDVVRQGLDKDQHARPTAEQLLLRLLGHADRSAPEISLGTALRAGSDAAATTVLPAPAAAAGIATETAPSVPVPAPTRAAATEVAAVEAVSPRTGWPRRLGRQAGDPVGISAAIVLGAGGFAAGNLASADTGTAAKVGALAFGAVYAVRLVVAAALDRGTEQDPSER